MKLGAFLALLACAVGCGEAANRRQPGPMDGTYVADFHVDGHNGNGDYHQDFNGYEVVIDQNETGGFRFWDNLNGQDMSVWGAYSHTYYGFRYDFNYEGEVYEDGAEVRVFDEAFTEEGESIGSARAVWTITFLERRY